MIPIEQVKELPALWAGGVRPSDKLMDILLRHYYELRIRTEWIPVLEKTPLFNIECLVYTSEGYQYVAALLVGGWWTEGVDEFLENVTHWMPLPEKPEVKE